MDFDVVVIDHSPVLTEQPDQLIQAVDFDVGAFNFIGTDSVVVLTRGERDVETLASLSKFKLRYVGMLGSRQRVREDLDKLRKAKVSEEFIASLRAPVGADIGAVTASEIALSIMAEIVAAKYGKEVIRKSLSEDRRPTAIEG
jgi:xanthine dehydrogenase accessory factor